MVYDVYGYVNKRLAEGDMAWAIMNDGSEIIQAAFNPLVPGQKPRIELNRALLTRSRTEPTIALTIIMHEVRHAYDYFTIGEQYVKFMENPVEKYLYEMDSLFFEAVFLRDYLAPRYKKISKFEQFLLASLKNDNLASASLSLLAVDMDLTYSLYKRERDLEKGLTCEAYLKEFVDRGKQVTDLPLNGTDFDRYSNLISIQTYAVMTSPLVRIAFGKHVKCKEGASKAAIIEELNAYISKANDIVQKHAEVIIQFNKTVQKGFFGTG